MPQVGLQPFEEEDDDLITLCHYHIHFGFLFYGCFISGLEFGASTSQVLGLPNQCCEMLLCLFLFVFPSWKQFHAPSCPEIAAFVC